jgi:hypothetical protein
MGPGGDKGYFKRGRCGAGSFPILIGATSGRLPIEKRAPLTCDIFLTGTNAITLTGKFVNSDAFGSRIAAMLFGPKKVIVVAGIDKVVRDIDAADVRIKMYGERNGDINESMFLILWYLST